MTNAALIARTQNDIAIMLEGRATAARDRAIATARKLIDDLTAEAEAAAEIIRVRGLTPAQAGYIHDPTLGHTPVPTRMGNGDYCLTAWGGTWVEGTRADLLEACRSLSSPAESVLEDLAIHAEEDAASLPLQLQASYVKRRMENTVRCMEKAARKIAKALAL